MKEIDSYIDLNSHIIDSIAISNLREGKPIIPLKIIQNELKLSLQKQVQNGELTMQDINEEKLEKMIYELINYLEGYIYTKNRIDLYKKEGLGLMIALDENDHEDMDDVEKHSDLYE